MGDRSYSDTLKYIEATDMRLAVLCEKQDRGILNLQTGLQFSRLEAKLGKVKGLSPLEVLMQSQWRDHWFW